MVPGILVIAVVLAFLSSQSAGAGLTFASTCIVNDGRSTVRVWRRIHRIVRHRGNAVRTCVVVVATKYDGTSHYCGCDEGDNDDDEPSTIQP